MSAKFPMLMHAWVSRDYDALLAVCTEHFDLARRFIEGLLDEPSEQVRKRCLQAALAPPPLPSTASIRAVVLQQAHRAAVAHRGRERKAFNHDVFGPPLPRSLAMALLDPLERCAWALSEVGATDEDARHVLGQELGVTPDQASVRMTTIRKEVEHRLWAADQLAMLHRRVGDGPEAEPMRRGASQRLEWMEDLTEDVRMQPEDPPAPERLLALVKNLAATADDVTRLPDIDELCPVRAVALFAGLALYYGNRWEIGTAKTTDRGRLVMLTYNGQDGREIEALHRELTTEARSRAGASLRIWIDWERIRRDQDAFFFGGLVILLMSRGFLISVGPSGSGPMQRHENHAIRILKGMTSGPITICEVGLGTIEGLLASCLGETVADLIVDLRIPERRDRIGAIVDCFS